MSVIHGHNDIITIQLGEHTNLSLNHRGLGIDPNVPCHMSPSIILSTALASSTCTHKRPYENTDNCRESLTVVSTGNDAHLLRFLPGGTVRRCVLAPPTLPRLVPCHFLGSITDLTQVQGWTHSLLTQSSFETGYNSFPGYLSSYPLPPSISGPASRYPDDKYTYHTYNQRSSAFQPAHANNKSLYPLSHDSRGSVASSRTRPRHQIATVTPPAVLMGFQGPLPTPASHSTYPQHSYGSSTSFNQATTTNLSSFASHRCAPSSDTTSNDALPGYGFFTATLPLSTQPIRGLGASATAAAVDAADVQRAHTIWVMDAADKADARQTSSKSQSRVTDVDHRETVSNAGQIAAKNETLRSAQHVPLLPESGKPDILSARIPDATIGWGTTPTVPHQASTLGSTKKQQRTEKSASGSTWAKNALNARSLHVPAQVSEKPKIQKFPKMMVRMRM